MTVQVFGSEIIFNFIPGSQLLSYDTPMKESTKCTECEAILPKSATCRDYLNEMIKWDFEDFTGVGQVHHLTVLSYNLQHPSVYSEKGLENAKKSLAKFILHPTSYTEHGTEDVKNLASDVREWKITSTVGDQGKYIIKPIWEMTAKDVAEEGVVNYVENVKKWSESVLKALKKSGNFN